MFLLLLLLFVFSSTFLILSLGSSERSQLEDEAMDASDYTKNPTTKLFDSKSSKHLVFCDDLAIETTITNKANIIEEWIYQQISSSKNQNQLIIGLDTEWMKDQNNKNKVAILQLCVKDKCLIIQLSLMDNTNIPQSLVSFLRDFNFKFVGVGIENDFKMLKNGYGLECKNGVELSTLAVTKFNNRVYSSRGLKYLAKELVGINMKKSKEICISKWQLEELTKDQIEYACIDAYVSYKIGHKLLIENEGIALNSSY